MKRIDWTKWSAIAEVLSAIAIVVTLAYLAIQTRYVREQTMLQVDQNRQNLELLRQNNEYLEAQSRYNHATQIADFFHSFATDRELSGILVKVRNGDQLDPVEALQLEHIYREMFAIWQWEFVEERRRGIPAPTDSWVSILAECSDRGGLLYPGIRDVWNTYIDTLKDDEFVSFIESNLAVRICE